MIYYQADPTNKNRSEDAIIAWTWKTFLENPTNPYVLLRMPMTKVKNNTFNNKISFFLPLIQAAVRAMDAVQQFAQTLGVTVPQKFVIGGASKVNKLSNLLF